MINKIDKFKKLYENVEELPMDYNDVETEETEELTFDKFNSLVKDVIEEDISDETMTIIFDVVKNLIKKECADETDELVDTEEEVIEEGFKDIVNFFKGGTPEEIEENKKKITDELTQIYNQYNGKMPIRFNVKGDNKTVEFNLADALKRIGKNNYLGTIISGERNGKLYIAYSPGVKGMGKLASGSNGSINTNR